MKKYLQMVEGFLATQLNYIPVLMAVFVVYYGILHKQPTEEKFLLLALVPFGFYLIRSFVNDLTGFFALHLLWAILPYLFAKDVVEKVLFVLISILFFGLSVYFKVAKNQVEDSILFAAMTFIISLISYFSVFSGGGKKAADVVALLAVVYIVFYLLYQYIGGYLDYIRNNEISNQRIPKAHIFKTSFSTLMGFVILFVGFALLLIKGNLLADLIYKIGDLLKRFIIWLLSFAPEGMEQLQAAEETEELVENFEEYGEIEPLYEIPPEIVELINNIVTVGAYLIFAAGILLVTYAFVKLIMAAFKVKHEANEEEVTIVKEKVTKVRRQTKKKREKEPLFTKERKIRKLYEDLILNKTVGGVKNTQEKSALISRLKCQTPKEHCGLVTEGKTVQFLYEKARYSDGELTKDDVKLMKKLCSKN